ncbi:S-methyl-5-thioribose-1-phosphate isomerase [Thoreauomyces humboldtii]|nr:S-methyl-5-thioribose-1-phosphate isomerase [Thoreauomyces humboldtii]
MKVRGAPAIAIVAALSLAVELNSTSAVPAIFTTPAAIAEAVSVKLRFLRTSRPTAVNLFEAASRLEAITERASQATDATAQSVAFAYIEAAEAMLAQDVEDNQNIGRHGAAYVLANNPTGMLGVQVLTHCNTGSLATAGWGTALGIIRHLHAQGHLAHAFCTETRPYNQGSRLTAYELVYEKIPATLICDSMASALLRAKPIAAIVVGADRVAANGDTANKIGTYQLAITAKYHGVPFLVAAPSTSIDLHTLTGEAIVIEERSAREVVEIRGRLVNETQYADGPVANGTICVGAPGIGVWNPAFDVTPAALISAIITERGVCSKNEQGVFDLKAFLA